MIIGKEIGMAKDLEITIKEDLNEMLNENEEMEYILYGKVSPSTKRLGIIFFSWTFMLMLFLLNVLSFTWVSILIVGIGIILTQSFFFETIYVGKFGKRLYMHRFDGLKIRNKKDSTLLKDVLICYDRTSDFHLTISVSFEDKGEFVIFRRSSEKKGLIRQSTNMKQLMVDINKKHKK